MLRKTFWVMLIAAILASTAFILAKERTPSASDIGAWADSIANSEQLMVAIATSKRTFQIKEPIPIFCSIYYPPNVSGTQIRLFDGQEFIAKSGLMLNPRHFNKSNPKRSLSINLMFTINAKELGIGQHGLRVLSDTPGVVPSEPMKIEVIQ